MRRRNLTMGEMSEFMTQQYGETANFARKSKRFGRKKKRSLASKALGSTLTGRLVRGAGVASAIGLAGTKKGRGLVGANYGKAKDLGMGAYRKVRPLNQMREIPPR